MITVGGAGATVSFAGLVSPGLFQFNVVLPSSLGAGDQPITATYNGLDTQSGTLIALQCFEQERYSLIIVRYVDNSRRVD